MIRESILATLERALSSGREMIGEVLLRRAGAEWELRHYLDEDGLDLAIPPSARALAATDEAGRFRPLKTAPNLRRGWRLPCHDLAAVRSALDHLYPAMLGVWRSHACRELAAVSLRETLGRQSGMYAVTRKISDEQAQDLVGRFCRSEGGCLKTILWRMSDDVPVTSLAARKFDPEENQVTPGRAAIPLLCHEACNLLVAEAREVVKRAAP